MCPAAGYAFFGGARGPRPTGRYVEPRVGDGVSTSPQRGSAALSFRASDRVTGVGIRSLGRGENGLPRRFAPRNDRGGRRPLRVGRCGIAPYEITRGACEKGGQSRPPLQTGNDRKHRRAARHARRVRSFIYWSRGGIYRATMWRRKLVSGDLRAGAGTGHPDRRRVSGGVPDVSGGVSADRLRRGVLA